MSQPVHWKKSQTASKALVDINFAQNDKLERVQTSLLRKESMESEGFTEQRTLQGHPLKLQESLNLSTISRSNNPSITGAFSDPNSRKLQPTSHFGRKKEGVSLQSEETRKLQALQIFLGNLDGEGTPSIKIESVTSAVLENSERTSVPSNLISGRSGFTAGIHSTTTVTQNPLEKEMLIKLSKIKAEKAKELRESKYFLLRVRLDDLNQTIHQLKNESVVLDEKASANKQKSQPNGSIAEIGLNALQTNAAVVDQKVVELASKIGRLQKSIESMDNKLKISKCKQSLLHVQVAILEEGFLSPNLSGSKNNNTKEVSETKREALDLIRAVNFP